MGLLVVSLRTANSTTESMLGPGIELLLSCGAMWCFKCVFFTSESQSSEVTCDCHCNTKCSRLNNLVGPTSASNLHGCM